MASKTEAQNTSESYQSKNAKNFLSQECGAEVVSFSSGTDGGGYGAWNLISSVANETDEAPGASWWTDQGAAFPHIAVLKICRAGGTISKILVSNHNPEDEERGGYRGIPAKDITIEGSVDGPDKGFKKIADLKLKRNVKKQVFTVPSTLVKWLRVTIKSNYGNAEYSILGTIEAY